MATDCIRNIVLGKYALQLHKPHPRRWARSYREVRFLLLGPQPEPCAFRPLVASGTLVDGAVHLDKGSPLDAEMVSRIESAVEVGAS